MGLRLIVGVEQGTESKRVVLWCSTSGIAFGPTFLSEDAAEGFIAFAGDRDQRDLRALTSAELHDLHAAWIKVGQPDINGSSTAEW